MLCNNHSPKDNIYLFMSIFRYMTIFNNLTAVGIENGSGYLEFCQSVLELIGRNSEFIKEPDCIWRLWSRLSNTLQDQINKVFPLSIYFNKVFPVIITLSVTFDRSVVFFGSCSFLHQ